MMCPRCGVTNKDDRTHCTRCSGSLAPPPVRHDAPPAVVPITRRAEVVWGRARAARAGTAVLGNGGPGSAVPGSPAPGSGPAGNATGNGPDNVTLGSAHQAARPAGTAPGVHELSGPGELYLLAADRATGQPPPPAPPGQPGPVRAERPGRVAV